ncbi:hypothetical protein KXV82_000923 [Aspergillus fumigatus]|nr:hypothetical protein KXV82_000923 [Aspergillus fumigatus]
MQSSTSPRNSSDDTRRESSSPRPISPAGDSPRRKSIQFNIDRVESSQSPVRRSSSVRDQRRSQIEVPERDQKSGSVSRGLSPPPPQTYERGVSFDTFDNPDAADFSLTLNYKHKGYQCTRRSRTFLCGTDQNDYSDFALEWLIDELVDDGDEIVCLRAVEKDSGLASDAEIEAGKYREEAERLFEQVIQKNSQDEKAISLVLELAVGRVQDIIQRMIRIYEPALLIVGTRGRKLGGVQGLLPGSVSKYCLQQSPIPVIVVRPTTKREKKKKKRQADPTRRSYNQILEQNYPTKSQEEPVPPNWGSLSVTAKSRLAESAETTEDEGASDDDNSASQSGQHIEDVSPKHKAADDSQAVSKDGDVAPDSGTPTTTGTPPPLESRKVNIPVIVTEDISTHQKDEGKGG